MTSCCFGKLPIHGDFIRVDRGAVELDELDAWQQEGMHRSLKQAGPSWQQTFDSASTVSMLHASPTSGSLLAGVWTPSRDRPGRRYPFVLGTVLRPAPAPAAWRHLPLALHASLQQATDLATTGWQGAALGDFQERVRALPWSCDLANAETAFADAMTSRPADELWRATLGESATDRAHEVLYVLSDLLQPPYPPRFVVRIPLQDSPSHVAFWLALIGQWAPANARPTLVTWFPATSGRPGALTLVLDPLAARYFDPVFRPNVESDNAIDLADPRVLPDAARSPARDRFAGAVETSSSLQELLTALSTA